MHHMICDKVPEALLDIVVLEKWVVHYRRRLLIVHYVPIKCRGRAVSEEQEAREDRFVERRRRPKHLEASIQKAIQIILIVVPREVHRVVSHLRKTHLTILIETRLLLMYEYSAE